MATDKSTVAIQHILSRCLLATNEVVPDVRNEKDRVFYARNYLKGSAATASLFMHYDLSEMAKIAMIGLDRLGMQYLYDTLDLHNPNSTVDNRLAE